MPADLDLNLPATTSGLRAALQSIEEICASHHVEIGMVARARIVVEELFTNTIKYGYGGECDRPVRLSLSIGSALTLILEDAAPPFDPTLWKPAENVPQLPSERQVGQAGIAMVLGLSSQVKYLPLTNGNRITIVIEPRAS